MTVDAFIEDVLTGDDSTDELSEADRTYLEFRQTIDPGMFDARFDATPAKSRAIRSRQTGKPHTDQTLRSHVLNGAAFGARLNHALRKLDPSNALSNAELLEAMALFSCHDLHKTREAQARRAAEPERRDADKDITEQEAAGYVDLLRLEELGVDLEVEDFRASALATEESSGRYMEAPSRAFTYHRDWIRVMDAAAGLDTPAVQPGLKGRVQAISDNVELASHRFDDTKGLTTNLLHTTIVDQVARNDNIVPVVYFVDGALYLSHESDALENDLTTGDNPCVALTDDFIRTLRDSRPSFTDREAITGSIKEDFQKGQLKIPSSMYLLSGLETSLEGVRALLKNRSEHVDWNGYNIYRYAMETGVAGNLLSKPLPPAEKTIPLGLLISTYYGEIYYPLSGEDRRGAIQHLCNALKIGPVGEWVSDNTEGWYLGYENDDPAPSAVKLLSSHFEMSPGEIEQELSEGIAPLRGGTRAFPILIAAGLLSKTSSTEGALSERPLSDLLERVEESLMEYYRQWPDDWDTSAPVKVGQDDSTNEKVQRFERHKQGLIWESFPAYLQQNLEVNQNRVFELDSEKTMVEEYQSPSQPHVCLRCNDVLVGSDSLDDFDSGSFYAGFSHHKPINPAGGEPTSVVCPQCALETTLRESVHDQSADPHYVFLAPDYFYAPGDVKIERRIREEVRVRSGYELLRLADRVLFGDTDDRSVLVKEIFDDFEESRSQGGGDDFGHLIKNYDVPYVSTGALGVFTFHPPRRDTGSRDPVTRIPRWVTSTLATIGLAWLTSSRALLTNTSIPATEFDDFADMIAFDFLPAAVQHHTEDSVTVSYLRDLPRTLDEVHLRSRVSGAEESRGAADDADGTARPAEATLESNDKAQTQESNSGSKQSGATGRRRQQDNVIDVRLQTDLEVKLYKLASILTITRQQHGSEIQRVKSVLERAKQPFPGAGIVLRGDDTQSHPRALHAALVLDTILYPTMTNRIESLAQAGFDTLHPDAKAQSNYEYERLFRIARDAISDGLAQNANREELVDIVAGDVMKAAARNEDSEYGEEDWKREAAEEFGAIFVNDIFHGICDGDFYELRRHENHLASGYNAAIRRQLQAFFDEHSD